MEIYESQIVIAFSAKQKAGQIVSRPLGDSEPVMHIEDTSTNGTGFASGGAEWLPIRKGQVRPLKACSRLVVPFNRKPHQEVVAKHCDGSLFVTLFIFLLYYCFLNFIHYVCVDFIYCVPL